MRHKYSIINFLVRTPGSDSFTAASKARTDIDQIARNNGIGVFNIKVCEGKNRFVTQMSILIALVRTLMRCERVIVQYPPLIDLRLLHLVNTLFRKKIVYLIHDIEFLRFGRDSKNEISKLNKADALICHTPNMAVTLKNNGLIRPLVNLYLFDYLSESVSHEDRSSSVVFAGNLKKAGFLRMLNKIGNVHFSLYGIFFEDNMGGNNVEYCGKFLPEKIGVLNGKYGLVWDGDSLDTCSGDFGKYLHYNSSHKISLYIRAKLPLIVWRDSSLADFVIKNKIGIAVSSLEYLDNELRKVDDSTYSELVSNISCLAEKLGNGQMFLSALKKIDDQL